MAKKLIVLLALFALYFAPGIAQRNRFVYLQTEDLTPFYIQFNGKTLSSTSAGYLLIGKLTDSIYPIKLGVLGSSEVQDYAIKVAGKDAGYVIKKSATQGWAMTDLQTNESQMSMEYSSAVAAEAARRKAMIAADKQRVSDSLAMELSKAEQAKKDSIAAATAPAQAAAAPQKDTVSAAAVIVPATVVAAAAANTKSENNSGTATGTNTTTSGNEKSGVGAAAIVVPAAIVGAVIANDRKDEDSKKGVADSGAVVPAMTPQQMKADSITKVIAQKEKELKDLQAALAATTAAAMADSVQVQPENASNKSLVAMDTITNTNSQKEGVNATAAGVVTAAGTSAIVAQKPDKSGAAAVVVAPALLDMEFDMNKDSAAAKKADTLKTATPKPDTLVPSIPAVVENVPAKTDTVGNVVPAPVTDSVPAAVNMGKLQRQPCNGIISREDMDAAMAKAGKLTDADEIIKVYVEAFNEKCITTTNLKKIANTLASDVSRYKLFEAAYPHTLDYYAYAELGSLIKDSYYSNKFKTLIQQ